MSSTDTEYFRQRAVVSRRMADGAFTPSVAAAHRQMAEGYEDLVRRFEQESALDGMSDDKTYDEATVVTAKDGDVVLDGPDGVDVKLTPEAAIETSDRLLQASGEAQGQRVRKTGIDGKQEGDGPSAA